MSDRHEWKWYHDDLARFRDALTFTEAETGFSARLIEKDYFCSLILQDLSGLFEQGLVFKGGTCLSKVHTAFFRLSEDLDFCVSIQPDVSRTQRRNASMPFRDQLTTVSARNPLLELVDPVQGHNKYRQHIGRLAYRSVVTGEYEHIKVEVSLREETVLPAELFPAHTLLRDPHPSRTTLPVVTVRALQLSEAFAEKIRAALTRRPPAIRDFFDIDHAVRSGVFGHRDPSILALVARKLAVPGNNTVDLSGAKIALLRNQLEAELRPVLRRADYEAFDLPRVVAVLEELLRIERSI